MSEILKAVKITVELPEGILVMCPKKAFKQRSIKRACQSCEHFKGLGHKAKDGEWKDRYAIRCGFVIDRSVQDDS